jgi:hypothetical protein
MQFTSRKEQLSMYLQYWKQVESMLSQPELTGKLYSPDVQESTLKEQWYTEITQIKETTTK